MRVSHLVILGTTLLTAGCNTTGMQTARVVIGERPLKVDTFGSLNPDCTSTGETVIQLRQAPQHGRVDFRSAPDFPRFAQSNIRAHCNARRAPATQVIYTAKAGYKGSDSFEVEAVFPSGETRMGRYQLEVR